RVASERKLTGGLERRTLVAVCLLAAGVPLSLAARPARSAWHAGSAPPAAAPAANPIQRENALPGTTAWRLPQASARAAEGYASEVSVAPGDVLHLHVSTDPPARYRIEI